METAALDSKFKNAIQLNNAFVVCCRRDSAWFFSDLQKDTHDSVDGCISLQVKALEPDLFELSVHRTKVLLRQSLKLEMGKKG